MKNLKNYEFEPLDASDKIIKVIDVPELDTDEYNVDIDNFDPDTFSIEMF